MPYIRDYNIWAIEQDMDFKAAADGSIILCCDQNGDTAYVLQPGGYLTMFTSDGNIMPLERAELEFVRAGLVDGILFLG